MFNIEDFINVDKINFEINYGLIIKVCLEIVIYCILIKLIKKFTEILFEKLLLKISDHEIERQYKTVKFLVISILNIVLFLFFATNILGELGIDMKPILATAGVLGVAVGFGAKRFIEDLISGLTILLTGQIRVGDYITVSNSTGTVEAVNLLIIKVRGYNGDVHYIRCGLIDKITNHTRDFSNPIVDVPVSYGENIQNVINVLKDVSLNMKNSEEFSKFILDTPEIVAIDAFLDSSILIKVRFKTIAHMQWAVQRRFRILVKEEFDRLGISIPFNQLDVHLEKIEKV